MILITKINIEEKNSKYNKIHITIDFKVLGIDCPLRHILVLVDFTGWALVV